MISSIGKVGLVGLQRAEFERAIGAQRNSSLAQVGIAIIGILSPFSENRLIDYLLAGASFSLAVTMFAFSFQHRLLRAYAGRIRRALVVTDGLGEKLSDSENMDLRRRFGGKLERASGLDDASYYDSRKSPGWERFGDHITESAFWTQDLYEHCAKRTLTWSAVCFLISAVLLYAAIAAANADQIRTAIQTFCAVLVLVVSNELLGSALAYWIGSRRVRDVVQRLTAGSCLQHEILLAWGDYNAAIEEAPLVPKQVYEARKDTINELWRKGHSVD